MSSELVNKFIFSQNLILLLTSPGLFFRLFLHILDRASYMHRKSAMCIRAICIRTKHKSIKSILSQNSFQKQFTGTYFHSWR